MQFYSFLCHAMDWVCFSGVVLAVLGAGIALLSGRGREAFLPLASGATMFVLTDALVWNAGDFGDALKMTERLEQLASMSVGLLSFVFICSFVGVAFALMLKKLSE